MLDLPLQPLAPRRRCLSPRRHPGLIKLQLLTRPSTPSRFGASDVAFEQEAPDVETLERQTKQVTETPAFQQWTGHMSGLLAESPKREEYRSVE
jgi:hypothetical protein